MKSMDNSFATKRISIFWAIALYILTANAFAAGGCPTGQSILSTKHPPGLFYKTVWNLKKQTKADDNWNGSFMIFSAESELPDKLEVMGYIWWWQDDEFLGCEKFEGYYNTAIRQLIFSPMQTSSDELPVVTKYSANLSTDNNTLTGKRTKREFKKRIILSGLHFSNQLERLHPEHWEAYKVDLNKTKDATEH